MLIFGDLHLNEFRQFATITPEGFNSRLIDQIHVVSEIAKLIQENKIRNVVFLGDLIDSYTSSLPKVIYNTAFWTLRTLAENAHVYVILGNHDLYRGMNVLLPLSEIPNVTIISQPTTLEIESHKIDMIPWGTDIPKQKSQVLMGHMAVQGSIISANGHKAEEGFFSTDLFGYEYVFLGHFHELQEIPVKGASQAKYLGSVLQLNRGSSPLSRGVILFYNKDTQFIPIPSPTIISALIDSQKKLDDILPQIEIGNYWHLTITDPNIKISNFDHRVQMEFDVAPAVEVRLEEKSGEDLLTEVKRFIENTQTKVDKVRVLELLKEIMK